MFSEQFNRATGRNIDINSSKLGFKDNREYKKWLINQKRLYEKLREAMDYDNIPYDSYDFAEIAGCIDDSVIANKSNGVIITENPGDFIKANSRVITDKIMVVNGRPSIYLSKDEDSVSLDGIDYYFTCNALYGSRRYQLLKSIYDNTDCGSVYAIVGSRSDKNSDELLNSFKNYTSNINGFIRVSSSVTDSPYYYRIAYKEPHKR